MNPEILKNIELAKSHQETDPASALVKIRIATELLVGDIYSKYELETSYTNLSEAISNGKFIALVPSQIVQECMHTMHAHYLVL